MNEGHAEAMQGILGQHWLYNDRMVKFNIITLEFMVYNKNTGQIITYFLPKWSTSNATNIARWSQEAYNYFLNNMK